MSFRPRGPQYPERTPAPTKSRFPQRNPDTRFQLAASPMRKQKAKKDSRMSAIKRKLSDNSPTKR